MTELDKDTFDAKVDTKMKEFSPYLVNLVGIRKVIAEKIAMEYCKVDVLHDQVQDKVLETGTMITLKNGNPAKNPDVATMHGLVNEKNALLPKLMKYVEGYDVEAEDELDAFLKG